MPKYRVTGYVLRQIEMSAIVEAHDEDEAIELILGGEGEDFYEESPGDISENNLVASEIGGK